MSLWWLDVLLHSTETPILPWLRTYASMNCVHRVQLTACRLLGAKPLHEVMKWLTGTKCDIWIKRQYFSYKKSTWVRRYVIHHYREQWEFAIDRLALEGIDDVVTWKPFPHYRPFVGVNPFDVFSVASSKRCWPNSRVDWWVETPWHLCGVTIALQENTCGAFVRDVADN